MRVSGPIAQVIVDYREFKYAAEKQQVLDDVKWWLRERNNAECGPWCEKYIFPMTLMEALDRIGIDYVAYDETQVFD